MDTKLFKKQFEVDINLEFHTCKKCMSELIANKFNEGRKNEQ